MIKKKSTVLLLMTLIIVLFLIGFFLKNGGKQRVVIETVTASKGTIQNTITATGTVEPTEKVEVGTQVSGVVQKIYVDFNSKVKKGQLIAQLDKTLLGSQLRQNKASLRTAHNEVTFQKKNLDRLTVLFENGMVSQEDLDKAQYSYQQAVIAEEKATVEVERARSNLAYASIYSPIDGIILSRAVDEGQTVAASLNAPTLFTIARNLTRMEVQANVDEADIGQIQKGQRVLFTVDAYPEKTFEGRVSQIRLEPKVVSNVVTYTITIDAENPDQQLLPGMTALITVYTKEALNVLTIPSKAVRFKPDREIIEEYRRQQGIPKEMDRRTSGGQKQRPGGYGQRPELPQGQTTVWAKHDGKIRPVRITTGISDGSLTEVVEGLKEGTEVIVAMKQKSGESGTHTNSSSEKTNPFMPRFRRRSKQTGGSK